jgi:hypothetical protein
MMSQEAQSERRVIIPLAYDAERLVATLMSPNTSLMRKLSAAERLYSLVPTYVWRMLTATAIKLAGKEALMVDKDDEEKLKDNDARRKLYADTLKSMLKFMEKTREKIVEVKLPPISIPEGLDRYTVPEIRDVVANALADWFYAATEEARKKGKPYSMDPSAPGYVILITFASLVIVNGLRQLTLIGE